MSSEWWQAAFFLPLEGPGHELLVQTREVRSSYGYMGSSDIRLHLGLGEHTRVDTLTIRWPSGAVQTLVDVAADRELLIEERADP